MKTGSSRKWGSMQAAGFLFLLAGLAGCYQPIEGCLDREASNFDVSADNACSDCCVYPSMRLALIHRMVFDDTTLTFRLNERYEDDFGQPYRISQVSYFFQGASLIKIDGERIRVQDSLLLARAEGIGDTVQEFYADDILRVEGSNFQFQSLGSFRGSGFLSLFELTLGLPVEYVQVVPASVPTGHPLSQTDLWTEEEGYAQVRMVLVSESPSDTLTKVIEIRSPQPLGSGVISAPTTLVLPPGFGTELTLQVDYRTWLRGVNTLEDVESVIADKITENLPNSFELVSVVTKL